MKAVCTVVHRDGRRLCRLPACAGGTPPPCHVANLVTLSAERRIMMAVFRLSMLALTACSSAAAQCTFTPNCDYGKGSREHGNATSRDVCCALCTNRPGCASGVWDGNRCWFKTAEVVKHGCQHSPSVKDACIPKSVKPGPPPTPPPPPPPPLSCSINGTKPETAPGKPVVALVGDSITYGSGCSDFKYGFAKAMNDTLGSKYDLRDCGVSGLDAVKPGHNEHNHGSYWASVQYKQSLAMKPAVVIVMLGTNDADEWCYAGLQNFVGRKWVLKVSRLAESERGVWFSWERYGIRKRHSK